MMMIINYYYYYYYYYYYCMVTIAGRITTGDCIFGVRECCKCQYMVQTDKQDVRVAVRIGWCAYFIRLWTLASRNGLLRAQNSSVCVFCELCIAQLTLRRLMSYIYIHIYIYIYIYIYIWSTHS